MTNKYYKNGYSVKEWAALIDKAEALGCAVTYSKYGNIATIDSTATETAMMQNGGSREYWADIIHSLILDEVRQRWGVYTAGVEKVRAWFDSEEQAEKYRKECESHENTRHEVRAKY